MLNDSEFINRLCTKDEDSFNQLFLETKEMIYNTALHLLQNETEAMDVMQDVYVEVFLSIDKFQKNSSLSTWMYRICINKSLESLRKQKRRTIFTRVSNLIISERNSANWVHPGVLAEQKDTAKQLYAAIRKLKDKEQVAFTLFHIQGFSQKQIAEITKQSIPAVETQIFRAKQKLSLWLIHQKE